MTDPTPPSGQPTKQSDFSMWAAFGLAWELGYLIALPAAVFAFGGAYLDKHFQLSPLFLVIGLLLAFTMSTIAVVRKVRSISSH